METSLYQVREGTFTAVFNIFFGCEAVTEGGSLGQKSLLCINKPLPF